MKARESQGLFEDSKNQAPSQAGEDGPSQALESVLALSIHYANDRGQPYVVTVLSLSGEAKIFEVRDAESEILGDLVARISFKFGTHPWNMRLLLGDASFLLEDFSKTLGQLQIQHDATLTILKGWPRIYHKREYKDEPFYPLYDRHESLEL